MAQIVPWYKGSTGLAWSRTCWFIYEVSSPAEISWGVRCTILYLTWYVPGLIGPVSLAPSSLVVADRFLHQKPKYEMSWPNYILHNDSIVQKNILLFIFRCYDSALSINPHHLIYCLGFAWRWVMLALICFFSTLSFVHSYNFLWIIENSLLILGYSLGWMILSTIFLKHIHPKLFNYSWIMYDFYSLFMWYSWLI